jgi:hypothetical protein
MPMDQDVIMWGLRVHTGLHLRRQFAVLGIKQAYSSQVGTNDLPRQLLTFNANSEDGCALLALHPAVRMPDG